MKLTKIVLISTLVSSLAACGGGGSASTSSGGNNSQSGGATPPTPTQASSTCSGTPSSTVTYDVFLPTANGITRVPRTASLYGASPDTSQCVSVAGSAEQSDNSPGTIQVVTSDGWNDAISYFDPVGTGVIGGTKFNQGLFVTCTNGVDVAKHIGVLSSTGSSGTYVDADAIGTVVKNNTLMSYGCVTDNAGNTSANRDNTTVTFGLDGSVVIADGANGTTTIAAADAPSLFTTNGYSLNGNILRWYLYQLPVGAGTKQVIVATNQKQDGSFGVISFYQP